MPTEPPSEAALKAATFIIDKYNFGDDAVGSFEKELAEIIDRHLKPERDAHAAEEQRLDKALEQAVCERDDAEKALSQAYYLITGRPPEWSNNFGHSHALADIDEAQTLLRNEVKERDAARKALEDARDAIELRGTQLDALLAHCGKEGGECSGCAKIICPFEEELHFHHDGCPACCNAPKDNPALLKRQKIDNIITTIDSVLPRKV